MSEVLGKAGQLVGLARLQTSFLHWGLAAGRPDSLVVATEGLVKVVQEGKISSQAAVSEEEF